MQNNFYFVKNAHHITQPLAKEGDKLVIKAKTPKEDTVEIPYVQREVITEQLKVIDEQSEYETFEEEFFGYLSSVNLDSGRFGFSLEGTTKHIPVTFSTQLNLEDVKNILGERIKIRAQARYKNKELQKLDIVYYELKKRKDLNDFMG